MAADFRLQIREMRRHFVDFGCERGAILDKRVDDVHVQGTVHTDSTRRLGEPLWCGCGSREREDESATRAMEFESLAAH